eukprot:CAMPEP_0116567568 /NCGR_PEP_ID=MMETSP0397-20121206/15081_1 /TAXON_ID=216820 /ORGANISM="Cyclophora tenuis, Strain ECT3854" /LENGTH=52 /DNA_ID=CAMNT_0004094577 /DNA_START=237 /DNA_END=392 /DNA_ORIENTATION=-
MNGMDDNPTPVGSHVLTITGSRRRNPPRETAKRDARTIALIVIPGIVTLARL